MLRCHLANLGNDGILRLLRQAPKPIRKFEGHVRLGLLCGAHLDPPSGHPRLRQEHLEKGPVVEASLCARNGARMHIPTPAA